MSFISDLSCRFDAVVMLTDSNWFTEPVSNRYHYATRFARHLPVIFVQWDYNAINGYEFEKTDVENITVLHFARTRPFVKDSEERSFLFLEKALARCGIKRPLLWEYGWRYKNWLKSKAAPLKIFHATEDYACMFKDDPLIMSSINDVLDSVDAVVAVSPIVLRNYEAMGNKLYERTVLSNGCDYSFWGLSRDEEEAIRNRKCNKRMIYQGGINSRLNCVLISQLAQLLPDWELIFCGRCDLPQENKELLNGVPNIRLLGELPIEEVRAQCLAADVGLIPFAESDNLNNSFPLKAFEYIAIGLPVISVGIHALRPYSDVITFAADAEAFAEAVLSAEESRRDLTFIAKCRVHAKDRDYDRRFEELAEFIAGIPDYPNKRESRTVYVIQGDRKDVGMSPEDRDRLCACAANDIKMLPATAENVQWDCADTVALLAYGKDFPKLPGEMDRKLKHFCGGKLLIVQPERQIPDEWQRHIKRLKIGLIYSFPQQFDIRDVREFDEYLDMIGHGYANRKLNRYIEKRDAFLGLARSDKQLQRIKRIIDFYDISEYYILAYSRFAAKFLLYIWTKEGRKKIPQGIHSAWEEAKNKRNLARMTTPK